MSSRRSSWDVVSLISEYSSPGLTRYDPEVDWDDYDCSDSVQADFRRSVDEVLTNELGSTRFPVESSSNEVDRKFRKAVIDLTTHVCFFGFNSEDPYSIPISTVVAVGTTITTLLGVRYYQRSVSPE